MKKKLTKIIAFFAIFCMAFTSLPMMAGEMESYALAKNIKLYASASGKYGANLRWNKIKSPNNGYAVFRDNKVIVRLGKNRTAFADKGLKSGSAHSYQIKTYKTRKITQWYNKKTRKWQNSKPAKKYRGKSRKVTTYSYKKTSNKVSIRTNYAYYTVTWKNWNGTTLKTQSVRQGLTPTYSGTPTRPADANYTYTFKGWNTAVGATWSNKTYVAQYTAKVKPFSSLPSYTITWKNWNDSTIKTTTVKKGDTPSFGGTPTRPDDANNTYTFAGWSPKVAAASADATYKATYNAVPKAVTKYTIIWENWDGSTIKTDTVDKGAMPSYSGTTPTRLDDKDNTYTFSGWTPKVVAASAHTTYRATYDAVPKAVTKYTVKWENWDGEILGEDSVEEGVTPSYSGTPTKPEDDENTYMFTGWSPAITTVTENVTYQATFKPISKGFEGDSSSAAWITWKNWDDTLLRIDEVEQGEMPSYGGTLTKEEDDDYTYTFAGWSPNVSVATSDQTYTAVFNATPKPKHYKITWKNGNDTLRTDDVEEGEMPSFGGTLTKLEDDNYTYTFAGWTPNVSVATSDQTYTAVFNSAPKPKYYAITWKNWNGSTLRTDSVKEGVKPSYGSTPTRPADSTYTYTFKGWTPSVVAANGNTTYTAEYTQKLKSTSQYNYNIRFVNQPYGNGGKTAIFLETNNPNPLNLIMNATNKNGKSVTGNVIGISSDYDDVEFTDDDEFYVGNGIPTILSPTEAGQITFNVYEINRTAGTQTKVAEKTVTVKDYKAEEIAWRQSVIRNVCNDSMSKKEKMQAICGYILTTFKYYPNYNGQYYFEYFKTTNIPYWIRKEADSSLSPAILVDFGNDLNYPLEDMFNKYERGTPEWTQYHMCAYSTADNYYFKACPPSTTNRVNPANIPMFNPSVFQFWGE